jgi:hypothetical protein
LTFLAGSRREARDVNEIHFRMRDGQFGNACSGALGFHEMRTNRLADVTCRGCRQAGEWAERVDAMHSDMDWGPRSRATVRLLAEDERQAYRWYARLIAEAETVKPGDRGSWSKIVHAHRARYGGTLGQARGGALLAAHEAALAEDIARDTRVLLANFTPLPASSADVEDLRMRVAALETAVQRLSGEAGTRLRGAPVNAAMDVSAGRTYSGNGRGVHDFRSSIGSDGLCGVIVSGWDRSPRQCGEPIRSAIHDPEGYAAYAAELKLALGLWVRGSFPV